jgi:CHAT domain-containing protein/Tfp pilus assembly protein PilF
MFFAYRASLLSLILMLSLLCPAAAHPQSSADIAARAAIGNLAAALQSAPSDEEQESLLAQHKDLMNSSLLAVLKDRLGPLFQKADYAEALRIAQLAVRIAERIGDPKGLGDAWTNLGFVYIRQNRPIQALDALQKGLAVCEDTCDKKDIARALHYTGMAHRLESNFDQALEFFNRSLAISEENGDKTGAATTLGEIGIVYRMRGNYETALDTYQKSLVILDGLQDKTRLKIVLNSIGVLYQAQGSYELALEFYRRSGEICEELNDKAGLAVALYNVGAVYDLQGRYTEALKHFQQSIRINEQLGVADTGLMGANLLSIGLLYSRQGRYDQALEYYRRGLKIREENNDKLGISQLQNNIGVIYRLQQLYDQALESLEKSLDLNKQLAARSGIATSLSNIGEVYRLQGRRDLALEQLRKSLQIREEIGDRLGISRTLENLALLYRDKGNYRDMLEVSRRAARVAEEINAPEELWAAQESIGKAHRALGHPAEARQSFLDAIRTIESLRPQVAGGEQEQQSFLENKLSPWLGMIDLLVSQHQYAEALSFAEQSKARALLDVLEAGRPNLRKSLSPQEHQTEEEKRLRLVALNSQLTRELRRDRPDPSRTADLNAAIARARLDFESLETNLYVAHPELKVHRGEFSTIKAEELTNLMPDTANALVEYVVTDDMTYLFVVTRTPVEAQSGAHVFTLPIKRTELSKEIETFRENLARRDLGFRIPAHKLYDLLLKPAEALLHGKSQLVIVPDDTLWDLPFQALLAEDNRYVIEKSAVSYAPSFTVLREMHARRNRSYADPAASTLLAVGNPAVGEGTIGRATLVLGDDEFTPLPEAEQEVRALGNLYGSHSSKIYIGADAREDRVKAEAGRARILHFATHGTMNNAAPMYSHLVLAQGDKNEDGLLEAWELMQLDLKAELAVLSACETARGRFGAGEGVIGLTWALFVAGVPSTVVSQWSVEAASTRDLMLSFHRALNLRPDARKTKAAKTEALRQAALKILRNPSTSHPFYWAGFVLVGDGR